MRRLRSSSFRRSLGFGLVLTLLAALATTGLEAKGFSSGRSGGFSSASGPWSGLGARSGLGSGLGSSFRQPFSRTWGYNGLTYGGSFVAGMVAGAVLSSLWAHPAGLIWVGGVGYLPYNGGYVTQGGDWYPALPQTVAPGWVAPGTLVYREPGVPFWLVGVVVLVGLAVFLALRSGRFRQRR